MLRRKSALCLGGRTNAIMLALFVLTLGLFAAPARCDILFQNTSDGRLLDWVMNGISRTDTVTPPGTGSASWKVVGSGDFTGDGKTDLLLRNQDNGQLVYWQMDGTSFVRWDYINPSMPGPVDWQVVGVADIDKD